MKMADQEKKTTALELQQGPALEKRELASDVLAAMARAQVQVRYIVAQGKPRDWDAVRRRILNDCERPAFAQSAMYKKPIGNTTITGFSIRFAEAAQRALGNLMPERPVIYDDATKRIVRITMTDLESNVTHFKDVLLEKTVERRDKTGRTVLSQRLNSKGEVVYLVEATEDELLTKESAISSKIERQLTLKILPGDIQDEAIRTIRATQTKADKADPQAAKNALIDAYDDLGVRVADLKAFLGTESLDNIQPKDMQTLRDIYTAIKEGETNWREVMEARNAARGTDNDPGQAPTSSGASKAKAAATKKAGNAPSSQTTPAAAQQSSAAPAAPAENQASAQQTAPASNAGTAPKNNLFESQQSTERAQSKAGPPPIDAEGWT
jgi:hypothetical protein